MKSFLGRHALRARTERRLCRFFPRDRRTLENVHRKSRFVAIIQISFRTFVTIHRTILIEISDRTYRVSKSTIRSEVIYFRSVIFSFGYRCTSEVCLITFICTSRCKIARNRALSSRSVFSPSSVPYFGMQMFRGGSSNGEIISR